MNHFFREKISHSFAVSDFKNDFCEFKKKKYCIECFKILQIYLCIRDEYTVMISNENIQFSASYPSPESSKKEVPALLQ